MSTVSLFAVSMMIGVPLSARIARQTSMPDRPGQHQVEQHDVGLGLAEGLQRAAAVGHEGRLEPVGAQHDAEHLGEGGVVVDHQHARLHAPIVASRSGRAAGQASGVDTAAVAVPGLAHVQMSRRRPAAGPMRASRCSPPSSRIVVALVAGAGGERGAANYVALGDSYSSGVGAGRYTASSGNCQRSTNAYSALWADGARARVLRLGRLLGGDDDRRRRQPARRAVELDDAGQHHHRRQRRGLLRGPGGLRPRQHDTCVSEINAAEAKARSNLPGQLDTLYNAIRARVAASRTSWCSATRASTTPASGTASGSASTSRVEDQRGRRRARRRHPAAAAGTASASPTSARASPRPRDLRRQPSWLHSVDWTTSRRATTRPRAASPAATCPPSPAPPDRLRPGAVAITPRRRLHRGGSGHRGLPGPPVLPPWRARGRACDGRAQRAGTAPADGCAARAGWRSASRSPSTRRCTILPCARSSWSGSAACCS